MFNFNMFLYLFYRLIIERAFLSYWYRLFGFFLIFALYIKLINKI